MSDTEAPAVTLASWTPAGAKDRRLWPEYVAFAAEGSHTYRETSAAQHLTVSAFVFDVSREHVLLCFHGKGRFWVQLGGHIERSDTSLADAAGREAREESGLETLTLARPTPVDLDRHALSSGFGTCQVHWDVGYAFLADLSAQPITSDESESVAWWPIASLPDGCVPGLAERIARVSEALRAG